MHVTKAASVVNDDDTRLVRNPVEAVYSLIVLRILRWILVADHPHYFLVNSRIKSRYRPLIGR